MGENLSSLNVEVGYSMSRYTVLPSQRDQQERDTLVLKYLYLPRYVVEKMWHYPRVKQLGWEDAEQEGMIALLRSAELWEENFVHQNKPVKFITYACRAIVNRILRAAEMSGVVHVSNYDRRRGVPDPVRVSLANGDEWEVWGQLPELVDDKTSPPGQDLLYADLEAGIREMSPISRRVVQAIFYRGQTCREVGKRLKVSHERVRQIKVQALAQLKQKLGGKQVVDTGR